MASQLRSTALPLAGLVGIVFASSTVHAEEHIYTHTKKPIYDAPPALTLPPTSTPTHPTPTDRLAVHIGVARRFINVHYRLACRKLDDAFSEYLAYERSVTGTIASLAPAKGSPEKVLPGAIYVAVAAMAGSIVTRRRMWPIRAVTPLAVGVASAWYFVPETAKNVGDLLWEWEKQVPNVAETHLAVREGVEDAWGKTTQTTAETRRKVDEAVATARKHAEDLVRKG